MNKKQALALLRRKRGRGRPSKAMAKKLRQARKLVKVSAKGLRHLKSKKMGKRVAKKLVGAKRGRGRPSLAMKAKIRKAKKVLAGKARKARKARRRSRR